MTHLKTSSVEDSAPTLSRPALILLNIFFKVLVQLRADSIVSLLVTEPKASLYAAACKPPLLDEEGNNSPLYGRVLCRRSVEIGETLIFHLSQRSCAFLFIIW